MFALPEEQGGPHAGAASVHAALAYSWYTERERDRPDSQLWQTGLEWSVCHVAHVLTSSGDCSCPGDRSRFGHPNQSGNRLTGRLPSPGIASSCQDATLQTNVTPYSA